MGQLSESEVTSQAEAYKHDAEAIDRVKAEFTLFLNVYKTERSSLSSDDLMTITEWFEEVQEEIEMDTEDKQDIEEAVSELPEDEDDQKL